VTLPARWTDSSSSSCGDLFYGISLRSATTNPGLVQRFRISATFNAAPLQAVLDVWARSRGAECDVAFAPFNQPLQTLLDLTSVFAQNRDGVNILLVRWEDLGQIQKYGEAALSQIDANASELVHAVRATSSQMAVPLVFCVCPPSPKYGEAHQTFFDRLNDQVSACAGEASTVHYLDYKTIVAAYPIESWDNPQGHEHGRVPYTDSYFAALGSALTRLALRLNQQPAELISSR
jgi:hypothetical protein